MNLTHSNNRLLKLADYLEQLPRGAINMETWLTDNRQHVKSEQALSTVDRLGDLADTDGRRVTLKAAPVDKIRECGFAACAVGWACTIPSFRKAGLHLTTMHGSAIDEGVSMTPVYQSHHGFGAAERFFGIDSDLAEYLFDSNAFGWSGKPRPSTVARRIRKVVEKRAAGLNPLPKDW